MTVQAMLYVMHGILNPWIAKQGPVFITALFLAFVVVSVLVGRKIRNENKPRRSGAHRYTGPIPPTEAEWENGERITHTS